MPRHSCITLPDDSVVINGGEYDFMSQELGRLQRENAELKEELRALRESADNGSANP
jgi:hypothetical protein